ncbi:MAG TPA: OB-fold nucleic acid binding domain-containing protein [Nitrospira sp.]|nr:OB-fold nucleic acid binding domain-containing protein [Nitrospira sp.]
MRRRRRTVFRLVLSCGGLFLMALSSLYAADRAEIARILEEPRSFHLRQVILQGTVRDVHPLDPYKLPAGTTCYGGYLFQLEDETASIRVAVFGQCGIPTVKDPDVEDGARIELHATIQAPSHGGYYLSFDGVKVAGEREGVIQAVADRIVPLLE